MIAWVRQSFHERLESCRYALQRLMLETPDRAAIDAFAAMLGSLRPLCAPRGVFKG